MGRWSTRRAPHMPRTPPPTALARRRARQRRLVTRMRIGVGLGVGLRVGLRVGVGVGLGVCVGGIGPRLTGLRILERGAPHADHHRGRVARATRAGASRSSRPCGSRPWRPRKGLAAFQTPAPSLRTKPPQQALRQAPTTALFKLRVRRAQIAQPRMTFRWNHLSGHRTQPTILVENQPRRMSDRCVTAHSRW